MRENSPLALSHSMDFLEEPSKENLKKEQNLF